MKRLYLLRHAQALPSDGGRDFDRSLSPKGLEDAQALGKHMQRQGYVPELILCSGAKRTRDTHAQVSQAFENETVQSDFSDKIYDASRGSLFKMIQDFGDDVIAAMIIGHNPTIYELCAMLASQGPETMINRLAEGYVPATFSAIDFPITSWADINPNDGQ